MTRILVFFACGFAVGAPGRFKITAAAPAPPAAIRRRSARRSDDRAAYEIARQNGASVAMVKT